MRAGPLSRPDVIDTLNRYYVPVFTSMEDYHDGGAAPAGEKAVYQKIYRGALAAKLSAGSVHAYVVTADGTPIDSLHVADAATRDNLLNMLRRNAERLHVKPGAALVKPQPQAACPIPAAEREKGLTLHLVARAEGTAAGQSDWHGFPAEDWIVLDEGRAKQLLPAAGATTWEVDPSVASAILVHFYPQTENNDLSTNRIDRQSLKATALPNHSGDGLVRARLDGSLRMKHTFYPNRPDDNVVDATVVGYMDYEPATGRVRALKLATDRATYGKTKFGVGVEAVR
jgi:hypothetical protein